MSPVFVSMMSGKLVDLHEDPDHARVGPMPVHIYDVSWTKGHQSFVACLREYDVW